MSKKYFYEIIFSRVALIIFVVVMFLIMGIAKQLPATVAVLPPKEDLGTRLLLPDGLIIKTEVVDTPELKSKGLSGRTSLGEHESMLFVFDGEGYYDFWMPDMNFALDIIWMDQDYKIVDISKDIRPMPETPLEELPRYRSLAPAQYILEVNSGFSDRYNLQVGDKLKLT